MTRRPGGALRANELALADRFYFLAYDVNGQSRLHQRAINYGLAASLVLELIVTNWAFVDYASDAFGTGVLAAIDRRPVAPPDLTRQTTAPVALPPLWRELISEPWRHPLRTWVEFAAPHGENQVVARLVTNGILARDRKRLVAVETVTGNAPMARLWAVLSRMAEADLADAALLAVADAVGLRDYLLDGLDHNAKEWLDWFRSDRLPEQRPDFAELATVTAAAVGASVLTRDRR